MIRRSAHVDRLAWLHRHFPVVAVLGPRQVGKTTLARQYASRAGGQVRAFDLESAEDLALLADPLLTLRPLKGLIVLDEVQRRPDLFPTLRVLVDEPRPQRRFLVLGSASPDLLHQTSESLAGRIAYHELGGLSLGELGPRHADRLWRRGGFPRSYLARSEAASRRWREELIRTYLERDLPGLGMRLPSTALRRFWTMLAHYHAQVWNASELARAFAVAHTTVQRYVDVLTATFMVRQLQPWHENIGKRQVKAPKVFIRDTGLLHALLGIPDARALETHPKVGASWEGFALEAVVARLQAQPEECFFWATHAGAEIDLLIVRGSRRIGVEFKRTTAPAVTRSMRVAAETLHLDRLLVVHAGTHSFDLARDVRAVAFARLLDDLTPLR